MITVTRNLHFTRKARGRHQIARDQPATELVVGQVPRISKLMALAIHCNALIRNGDVANQSELARLLHVTQPRMTQIMNLLHLAPEIQESILFLPRTISGRDPIHEKMLRPIAAERCWQVQGHMWSTIEGSV